jgi:hypothetical protein
MKRRAQQMPVKGGTNDGMTSEIAGQLWAFGSTIVTDPVALAWLYEGGPLSG